MEPKEFLSSISGELSSKFAILLSQNGEIQSQFVSSFYDYFGRLLNSFNQYLPLGDDLVQLLDFVELKDTFPCLKKKIEKFCKEFNLAQEENGKKKLKEELNKLKDLKIEYYRENSKNVLHMWDHIEAKEKLSILPEIVRLAESLPTSSATIEQSFSNIKLIKTDLRNRLSELSLEGLILIGQEFRSQNKFSVTETMVELFENVSKEFWKKKVIIGKVIKEVQNHYQNQILSSKVEEEVKYNSEDNTVSHDQNAEDTQFSHTIGSKRWMDLENKEFLTEQKV